LSANAAFVVNTVPVAMSKSEVRVVLGTYPAASGVEVTVHSSLKFGLVDWGRNRENIEKLFRRVAGLLTATSGAWLPDPSTRHELRWWDGSRWTENVSDSGRPGVDAL
jgi:aminoglycoside N3'-acetyltransferase